MDTDIKNLHFGSDAQRKLLSGIDKMVSAVGVTLGARGQTVMIESQHTTGGMQITKDGVTVAKSINLFDPVENMAVRLLRQASERSAKDAGDGTTTAVVIAGALIGSGLRAFNTGAVGRIELIRAIKYLQPIIIERIKQFAIPVDSDEMIENVAVISANNDHVIGKVIGDVYKQVGLSGIVTAERGELSETYSVVTNGLRIKRGISSPVFINDRKRDVCSFANGAYVLTSSIEISNLMQLQKPLEMVVRENKALLIIAPCSQNVLNTIAANVVKNGVKWCVIEPPSFGWKQHEMMDDLALITGAKHFSEKTGSDLSFIDDSDLGWVDNATCGRTETTLIMADDAIVKERTSERVAELNERIDRKDIGEDELGFLRERLAMLNGLAGVVLVGAQTDVEQKELLDRVDDAVCAVRSAMQGGIVAGGGACLLHISDNLCNEMCFGEIDPNLGFGVDELTVVLEALTEPFSRIVRNAGLNGEEFEVDSFLKTVALDEDNHNMGIDVISGDVVNMMDAGIVDPAKVTIAAIQNAFSVAVTILSTSVVVTLARTYDTEK